MNRVFITALLAIYGSFALAQSDKLIERHARIKDLQREGSHAEVVNQIGLQRKEAVGTPWQDSIHTYAYALGRAVWKSQDADAGIAAAQGLVDEVERIDHNALHQLDAMDAYAKLLFEMGRMLDCARADSTAMVFADAHKEVSLIRRGKARQRLALDYAQMGDYERSLKYYLEAKAVYGKSDSLLALVLGEACSGAGSAYWHLGDNRKADTLFTQSLSYFEKSNDPKRNFRMVGVLINRGILWQSAGDFNRSKSNYLESIRRCSAVVDTTKDPLLRDEAILARTRGYVNLATVYFAVGDDGRSRELLEMALRDREKLLEPDDPKLLGVKDRLADLELEAKNYAKAEKWVRAYLEACEKYYGVRSEDYARTCSKLGDVYAGLGRNVAADSLFKRSIELNAAMENAGTNAELASAYRRHAQFCIKLGRNTEAMKDLEAALAIITAIHGEGHHKVAAYELLLAEAAFANGEPHTTLRHAEHALGLLHDRAEALRSSSIPQTWPQPHLLPDALYWKVKAERALGMASDDRWKSDMDLSVQAMERNKAAFDDEGSQLGFIGQQKVVFDQAIDLAGESYAQNHTPGDLDRFLALTEADRSILLKSRLNDFTGLQYTGVPDSIIVQENRLISALDLDPEDRAATADLAKREQDLADFLVRLSKSHPHYFDLRYGEARVTVQDVRSKLLSPDRDLLLYAFTDEHLYMLVIGMDTAALVHVPAAGIAETVKALNAAILERRQESYVRLSRVLYTKVFEPLAGLLRKPELLIIPDGDLQTVNFETLLFGPADRGKLSEHMLIQKYAIGYLLSATTAVQFKSLDKPATRNVLAFAPGFSDELKQGYLAQVPDSALIDRGFLRYVRQPFAVSTAQELGSLVSARVNVGADASEERFREEAKEYGVLHLGTHAEMNASSPMYSRLVFSKDGAGVDAGSDGYLHAYEIYELDLRAQLAVLTACETGAGKNDQGEGVRSLGYGFAYAGCPSLVMSLWSIDEKVSSEINTRFYGYLAEGMPKHQALRQAKLDHLSTASDELALPYYWAGMVLVGDVSPLEVGSTGMKYLWWGLAGFALTLALLWWRKRRNAARH
ncbi:MAG: CHAT domain-containing tetratricopeptide repeat protein [Flavobacteriales bacterium]